MSPFRLYRPSQVCCVWDLTSQNLTPGTKDYNFIFVYTNHGEERPQQELSVKLKLAYQHEPVIISLTSDGRESCREKTEREGREGERDAEWGAEKG